MTVKLSLALYNILAPATSKIDWVNKLQTALGNTFQLRMFRDSNPNSIDPVATGVEFLSVGVTGPFKVSAGNIVGFGTVSSTSIKLAADLLTGKSVMVLQGNGHTVTASLGLTKGAQSQLGVSTANLKDYDYALFSQPTASGGIGFIEGAGLKSPILLNSGVGPGAPDLTANAPAFYRWVTYPTDNTEANRVNGPVKAINVRDPNLVFDRPWIAKQIGDVRQMRSAAGDGTVFGVGGDSFRYAPYLLVTDKSQNADNPNEPVYDLRFNGKPEGRWASFPYKPDFNIATDTLSMVASKVELFRADMTLLDVIEHYPSRVNNVPGSGKPFNFNGQYCNDGATTPNTTNPIDPWYNCLETLRWSSARHKPSTYRNHLHPGVAARYRHPSQVKAFDAWPQQWPVITGASLSNGAGAWRIAPKWSRALGSGFDTTIIDTVFETPQRENYRTQQIGYGYTPGATMQKTVYSSPGGHRHDRTMWSHGTVLWLSDPTGVRVHGAVPLADLYYNWTLSYHNEPYHYFTNPELNQTIDKDHLIYGKDAYNDTYYNGGNEDFRPTANIIRLLTQGNASGNNPYRDKNGRVFTNESQRDDQHNISSAAHGLYFGNDPMAAYEARDSFNSSMLATFGMTQSFSKEDFLQRQHGWFFNRLVDIWVCGNNSPNGVSSAEAEFMMTNHLSRMVDAVLPAITNPQTFVDKGLRDLGLHCDIYYASNGTGASLGVYDSKAFYIAAGLQLAKQSGFLDRLRAISSKNAIGIDLIVNQLCKASVDFFNLANGRPDNAHNMFIPFDTANPPASFAWSMFPANGQQDWIHVPDGRIGVLNGDGNYDNQYIEGYNTQHLRAQFVGILANFLTEYSYPGTQAALAKVNGWYDQVESQFQAGGANWHYLIASFAPVNAPAVVGAPT